MGILKNIWYNPKDYVQEEEPYYIENEEEGGAYTQPGLKSRFFSFFNKPTEEDLTENGYDENSGDISELNIDHRDDMHNTASARGNANYNPDLDAGFKPVNISGQRKSANTEFRPTLTRPENKNTQRSAAAEKVSHVQPNETAVNTSAQFANVSVQKPVSINGDIIGIAKDILADKVVIISLENCKDLSMKTRMMVFLAGVVYAREGHFYRVKDDVCLAVPKNCSVTENVEELFKSREFLGL